MKKLRHQFELQNVANLAANGNIVSSQQLERIAKLMQAEREIRTAVVDHAILPPESKWTMPR